MTVFEKIYWTSWIVNALLYLVGVLLEREFSEFDNVAAFLESLIKLDVIFTNGYWIVKLVLWIWGIHICLFPSLVGAFTR